MVSLYAFLFLLRIALVAVAVVIQVAGALQRDSILRKRFGWLRLGLLSDRWSCLVVAVAATYGIDHERRNRHAGVETLADLVKNFLEIF